MDQLSVKIAGQRIAYLESSGGRGGQDDRTVIFVHGNSSSARTWLPVLTGGFGRQFRCLALDLPGHGQSEPARDQADYSLPGYAAVLAGFARTLGADDAVVVGWSMGGQIALEAAPALRDAAGFAIFGAPPVASAAQFPEAFLPNPAMNATGSAILSESEAQAFAGSFTAPGSALATGEFVSDILATDGAARAGLGASVGEGRFADEIAIVAELRRPLAILHGTDEQLVRLDYLRRLTIPALWRGEVQLIPGAGHAPHQEQPQRFAALLTDFIGDLEAKRAMSPSPAGSALETAAQLYREGFPADQVTTGPQADIAASRLWNARTGRRPSVVARCHGPADVRAAVRAARTAGMPLSVLAGGHDWAGGAITDGGLVLDLGAMRQVTVDGAEARVAGGATVSDVQDAARPHGYAAVTGTMATVGFAGVALGGGYGTLAGVAGLAADNLLSAEVVLADGRVVTADPDHEPDLFWALRGGGGNFGVVTGLRVRLHPFAAVTTGLIAFGLDQGPAVLRNLRDLTASADDALHVQFGTLFSPAGQILFTAPTWAGDPGDAAAQIARVRALGEPVLEDVSQRAIADAVHAMDEVFPPGRGYRLGSRILPGLTDGVIDAFLRSAEAMPPGCALNVHHAHGAATRVPVTGTAYAYRDEHLTVEIIGCWADGDGAAESAWVAGTERRLDPHALPGGWANLMAPGDPRAQDAYGVNTARLLAAKKHYDPDEVFTASPLPD